MKSEEKLFLGRYRYKELFSIPNILGYIRIIMLIPIAIAIIKGWYITQVVLLFVSSLTDFLDGKIARHFDMVTEWGKALDPIADKLTLCVLYVCLAFKNPYVFAIVAVMIPKEIIMGGLQLLMMKKTGKNTGGAKWYGKICTALLFLSLLLFLMLPGMSVVMSNVWMLLDCFWMLFTLGMYFFQFRDLWKQKKESKREEAKKRGSVKKELRRSIITGILVLLIFIIYIAAGIVISSKNQPVVSRESRTELDHLLKTDEKKSHEEKVRLITDNEDALLTRVELIREARESIILSTFDFRPDSSGSMVAGLLFDAAQRGVDIKILVDGYSDFLKMSDQPIFQTLAKEKNVEIRIYNPVNILTPWNLMGRMHDKYLLVDNQKYLLGGRNTYNYFLGNDSDGHKNYDMEVLVEAEEINADNSICQVKDYFESVWSLPCCSLYKSGFTLTMQAHLAAGRNILKESSENALDELAQYEKERHDLVMYDAQELVLLSNPVDCQIKEPWVWYGVEQIMEQAKERVYIHTPYIIANDYMYEGLCKTGEAVPDTRLLLNAPENGANPFGCSDYIREKERVMDSGFSIYEYNADASYHTKSILVDRNISIVGSFNMDMRSAYLDTELMLVIKSEALNEALYQYMTEKETYCNKVLSIDSYEPGENVSKTQMTEKQERVYGLINFLTKHFRYLL